MKRFILNLMGILLMCLADANARSIHWITFIDTDDARVGEVDVLGREVLYSNFINEVNAALAPEGYIPSTHDYFGRRVTPENCKSIVQNLRVEPEDIVVFYYIGHGGRPRADENYIRQHPYPQMCMAQWNEQKFIPLEWVNETLSKKGARLSVTIGMCCNSESDISIKSGPKFTPNYGASYMSSNKMKNIQNLFLNYKGNVLSTSASPKQTSGCLSSGFGIIDAYTTVLCEIFKNSLDSFNGELSWDLLLSTMKDEIHKITEGEQTPIHDVSRLSKATAPAPTTPKVPETVETPKNPQPQETTVKPENIDDMKNELASKIGTLINVRLPEYDRIKLEKLLGSLFAKNAQVRILGQDSNDVIDREDIDTFLGRLATSRLLLNVAIVDCSFDAENKIKSLKIRETYKK